MNEHLDSSSGVLSLLRERNFSCNNMPSGLTSKNIKRSAMQVKLCGASQEVADFSLVVLNNK